MRTLFAVAALAAMSAVVSVAPVSAQSLSYDGIVMADHSMRASKLIGLAVTDDHGMKLGTIVDVLVKGEASEPTVILSTGTKMVAAPLSHVTVAKASLVMPGMTMPMMAAMPAYVFSGLGGGGG